MKEEFFEGQKVIRKLKLLADSSNIYVQTNLSPEERKKLNDGNIEIFKKVINEENPDVVFVWNLYFFDGSFIEEIKNCEKKTVYFLSDNWLVSFIAPAFLHSYFANILNPRNSIKRLSAGAFGGIKKLLTKRNKEKFFNQRAIFSSQYMENFHNASGIKFSEHKIILNGVDFSNISGKLPISRGYSLMGKTVNLLFAGRVVNVKGVHILIKALAKLVSLYEFSNFKLTILGDIKDEAYVNNLRSLIELNNLQKFVEFKENVPEERLFEEFQKYDVYVFPSLYEPFSLTLICALAAGIPTIASNIGGNPEIVKDGETGLLYDAFNADSLAKGILKLIKNPELRAVISKTGIETASFFTLAHMVSRIDEYLKE